MILFFLLRSCESCPSSFCFDSFVLRWNARSEAGVICLSLGRWLTSSADDTIGVWRRRYCRTFTFVWVAIVLFYFV